jgi:hypothetical protein
MRGSKREMSGREATTCSSGDGDGEFLASGGDTGAEFL